MNSKGLVFLVLLSLLGKGVQSYRTTYLYKDHGSGPEDKWTAHALEILGRSPQLLNILLTADIPHKDLLEEHLKQIPVPRDEKVDAVCTGCTSVVGTLNFFVNVLGVSFEDIRDAIVDACIVLANGINVNGNVLCPGTIDNYGPLVYDIIKTKNPNPAEACGIWNYCPPELPELPKLPELPELELQHPMGRSRRSPSLHLKHQQPEQQQGQQQQQSDLHQQRAKQPQEQQQEQQKLQQLKQQQKQQQLPQKTTKKNLLKIAHMTDIHVDHKYLEGTATDCGLPVCCRLELDGEGSARRWGEYACNIPPATTETFLRRVADLDPDFVVYTGDNPPHSLWEESLSGQLNVSRWVADIIGRNIPGKRAYSTMGNHETFPSNLYYTDRPEIQELNRQWYKDWAELSDFDSENEVTINNAGYYTKLHQPGLRILAFNSNYGYTENWYVLMNDERQEYADMKNFMQETLAEARANGEKVILVGHHPAGSGVLEYDWFMADLLNSYSDVIVLHVLGHTHNDEFRVDVDDSGAANHVEFVGQTMNSRSTNPGFRIFYLDPDTFEVQDYSQYYIDLNTVDEDNDDPVVYLYSAVEEFGLTDMSAESWRDLIVRMAEDDELFQRYYQLRNSNSRPGSECSGTCKVNTLCTLASNSYDRRLLCRREAREAIGQ